MAISLRPTFGSCMQVSMIVNGLKGILRAALLCMWTCRIRERPAYTKLREHIDKIDELKAQL